MAFRKKRKLSKKEQKALKKEDLNRGNIVVEQKPQQQEKPAVKKTIELPQVVTIREFAETLSVPVSKILTELLKNGIVVTINESVDFDTATIIADSLGYDLMRKDQAQDTQQKQEKSSQKSKNMANRPPVVVILGHVDHGKTTLLDKIRQTDVVGSESGGITQHIGAYQLVWKNKKNKKYPITFLDTPGHEAFSAMRAHGANITDIAVLVVAADDGVKPQTKEAISHAKAAEIPIIVAINKIDKPEANIEKVKRELADLELLTEEWGGKTIIIPVSAKTGKGINELLDMILIVSEMEELKANFHQKAKGVVIESHMQLGIGPLATILIQEGTLNVRDMVMVGNTFGKVKRLEDYKGRIIDQATPSMPVRVAGLKEMPNFGDMLQVVDNEREANILISAKKIRQKHLGLAELSEKIKSGEVKELNIILKTDTQGSQEAIKTALSSISTEDVAIKIIHHGVGNINESDVNLAISSKAVIVGFKVKPTVSTKNLAQSHKIKISTYDIIYNLIDDLTSAISGLLKPEIKEIELGKLEVLKIFRANKKYKIVGGVVIDGVIKKGANIHIFHSNDQIGNGKISSLEQNKLPAEEIEKGFECGLGVDTDCQIKPKDIISAYMMEERTKKISKSI